MSIGFYEEATDRRVDVFLSTYSAGIWHVADMHAMDAPLRMPAGSTRRIDPKDGSDSFAVSTATRRY